jgi:hypothetical protein
MDIRLIFLNRQVISKECAAEEGAYIMRWKRLRTSDEARTRIGCLEKLYYILCLSPVP